MKCLQCNELLHLKKNGCFTIETKGETLEVTAPCMACKNCGFSLMDTKQMSVLRRASAEAYKKKTNLKNNNK